MNKTHELWTGKRPSLKHLHIWGCPAEARPYRPHESKLESRTVSCYFVGYPKRSRGYKFYNPTTRSFFETGNARFLEDVEFGKEENIRNVVFEEEPVIDSDQVLVPITIPVPTPVIGDNHGVIPDIVPTQDNIEVLPQIPIEQAQQSQEVPLRRSTRERKSAIPDDYIVFLQEHEDGIGLTEDDPINFCQAMQSSSSQKWIDAMKDERKSIQDNDVCTTRKS
uniref:Retrovirus-related Pol polyprotein from transposon TNT 1-94 n=1 Tax=Cajanus cajan TaxID=3821 RepID=A0A151RDQ3_CAJCA|nr:Retrovirus-related Pol polyprotein from transposon TNT 1-94 [Cajanus cajan]